MQLFVVRHAIAKERSASGHDADRELTKSGIRKFRRGVRGLARLRIGFDRIVTSPWARAAATAELLAKYSDATPLVTELLCRSPRPELFALIAETTGPAHPRRGTAIVGHEPWLGELTAWLAFGDSRHGEALALQKGGIVWLDGSVVPGGMTVRAILPPKLLRRLR